MLLADLPGLSVAEMVVLWDAFWTSNSASREGFASYGPAFARNVSRELIDLAWAQPDPALRSLAVSMVLQDTSFLSESEVNLLRTLLEADQDPGMRRWAERLPEPRRR